MANIVKYGNVFNLLPMPEFKAKEMDIFMTILSIMWHKNEQEIKIGCSDFFKTLESLPQNQGRSWDFFFKNFKDFAFKILDFKITYETPNKKYAFVCFDRLVMDMEYNEPILIIKAQDDFYKIIKSYELGFTRFELLEFADLTSTYAKIIYRLLKQFRATGMLHISIEEFRRVLKIPDSYGMNDIDSRVLKPAIKELTQERTLFNQTRIPFDKLICQKIKGCGRGRGGKVTAIKFFWRIETKKPKEKPNNFIGAETEELKSYIGRNVINNTNETIKISDIKIFSSGGIMAIFKNCDTYKTFTKTFDSKAHFLNYLKKFHLM